MTNIIPKLSSKLSKMWTKVLNLENCLFPELKEQLRTLSEHSPYQTNTSPLTKGFL
jgi:hypothetical protein